MNQRKRVAAEVLYVILLRDFSGGPPPNGGTTFDNRVEGAVPPTVGVLNEPAKASGGGGGGDGGDSGGGDGRGGDSGGGVFVLERDAVGLWPSGRHGIHNAFMITKPKNPILLECIFRIVSAAKNGWYARGGLDDDYSAGWMTRPLFVTGPGLLGDVWRGVRQVSRHWVLIPMPRWPLIFGSFLKVTALSGIITMMLRMLRYSKYMMDTRMSIVI